MPKHLQARAAQDEREERQVRKLAGSHHAPADWKFHAQMVVESWAGKTPQEIATTLSCHPRTVRLHLNRRECGRDQRPGNAGRSGTQTAPDRAGAQPDSRPGQATASREVRAVCANPGGPRCNRFGAVEPGCPHRSGPCRGYPGGTREGSAAFTCVKAGAGVAPTVGAPAMTRTLSHKHRSRHPLHPTASGSDDHLHRRTRTGDPAHLCASSRLVFQRPPH